MKKAIILIICLLLVLFQSAFVYAEGNDIIPTNVQKVAQDSLISIKAKISLDPSGWGFADESEIDKLVLGQGQLVHFLGTENIEKSSDTSLSQLEVDSIDPVWLYTLELDGTAKIFLEVSTQDDGASYYLLGFGGKADLYQKAKVQFLQMLLAKDLNSNIVLYSASGRYILASPNSTTEWALPVPIYAEIDSVENWEASQLWTSSEVIQVIRDGMSKHQEGSYGGDFDFSQKPSTRTSANKSPYLWIIIPIIALVVFTIFMVMRITNKSISLKRKPPVSQ